MGRFVSDAREPGLPKMQKDSAPQPVLGAWSEPNHGLSGRLRVEFEDLKPGLRHAVYLELKNLSFDPVAVTNQPQVHAELFDSSGKPIATSDLSISGPIPQAQWAVLPRDAYLGFRIDLQTGGVPTREHGLALMGVGGKGWLLRAGTCRLQVALEFKAESNAPKHHWSGQLQLPPVEVVITPSMLAVK